MCVCVCFESYRWRCVRETSLVCVLKRSSLTHFFKFALLAYLQRQTSEVTPPTCACRPIMALQSNGSWRVSVLHNPPVPRQGHGWELTSRGAGRTPQCRYRVRFCGNIVFGPHQKQCHYEQQICFSEFFGKWDNRNATILNPALVF